MPLLSPSSRRTPCAVIAVMLGVFAREAAAQEAAGVTLSASSPPPMQDNHPLAFRADLKLPFTVSTLVAGGAEGGEENNPFAPVPQLVLGLQFGRIGIGAGLGFTRLSASTTEVVEVGVPTTSTTVSLTELMIAPTLTVDVFQSNDGKVAFYVLGAPIFGDIIITNASSETDVGFQFALGANVALHENFRVGLEAGPVGHFYNLNDNESESTISIYTALVGTFVYPR
jgi:hypothetical protein